MLRKVLVATDLSEASHRIIGCLHGLRPLGAEEAILVHALGLRHLTKIKTMLAEVRTQRFRLAALESRDGFIRLAPIGQGGDGPAVTSPDW